jgi:hypothetical protein
LTTLAIRSTASKQRTAGFDRMTREIVDPTATIASWGSQKGRDRSVRVTMHADRL